MTTLRFTTVISAEGPNGNIFAVIGMARRLMRDLGVPNEDINAMSTKATTAKSYTAALDVIREWFPVYTGEES